MDAESLMDERARCSCGGLLMRDPGRKLERCQRCSTARPIAIGRDACPRCGEPVHTFQRISLGCACGRVLIREDVRCVGCRNLLRRYQRVLTALEQLGPKRATIRGVARQLNVQYGTVSYWIASMRRAGLLTFWQPNAGRRPGGPRVA